MKRRRFWGLFFSAAAAALLLLASSAVAQHEHGQVLKVGKKGQMKFDKETRIGDVVLKPGLYTFQHRVDGEDHFVHFTQVTEPSYSSKIGGGAPKAHPGEVKCRLEPLSAKVSRTEVHTAMEGGVVRITKVIVGGENVAHVF